MLAECLAEFVASLLDARRNQTVVGVAAVDGEVDAVG